MAKGLSLHIGLNRVDPKHYAGWSGPLIACEADATDMQNLAQGRSFHPKTLLTAAATRQAVIDEITAAANMLQAGDTFFMSYSGHGGQVPDTDGDEQDGKDETWCLFDGQLVDDEIYHYLGLFHKGTRILVLSDSCHSGTVLKEMHLSASLNYSPLTGIDYASVSPKQTYRAMPEDVAQRVYLANRDFYDDIGKDARFHDSRNNIAASALLISGCQDNQLSRDGTFNGLFTGKLKIAWNGGKFRGDYRTFYAAIKKMMPPDQTPNLFWASTIDAGFAGEQPFSIDSQPKKELPASS